MRRLIAALSGFAVFAAMLLASAPAPAQSQTQPSAESLAAARELVQAGHATDNLKKILPTILQNLKAAIVQNRPEVERQYDSMMPLFTQKAQDRLNELTDAIAVIYANNFTVDELHDIAAFYRTPTGQKPIARQAVIAQQSMAMGQQLGRLIAQDVQQELSGRAN
ncbi:MAG: DUF2059 domain-containing protein [Xanthobacteraceae bacterium]